ncbi:crossover junction endodeoxyribonuclease RuvC [Ornithinimicrobium sp. INDO-MA30-4]|uniref:crossover junction endodeoxyribonuclease RuvC n=1 Tax=Ornithinimicrobium sp. INDO-MA30-4 TaxID=2908651 RepID=UPI002882D9D5|nr:crossover junction endodeoxyribonuclease RuvC [Ornithinimicrobium sp. INDO-MA30-4]
MRTHVRMPSVCRGLIGGKETNVRVLGVDPGLTRCGLGVVEGFPGRQLSMVAVGVVRTPVTDDPQERLLTLQTEIDQWLHDYQPDAVAVERVFAKANIKGIMGTAQASAVPMLAAARLGLPLQLHTPTEVKAAVTGSGRAEKAQVTHMVTRILKLEVAPKPADAADALALAICHIGARVVRPRSIRPSSVPKCNRLNAKRQRPHPTDSPNCTHNNDAPAPNAGPLGPAKTQDSSMIATLAGTIAHVGLDHLVVETGESACTSSRRQPSPPSTALASTPLCTPR